MSVRIDIDTAAMNRSVDLLLTAILKEATRSIGTTTKGLERDLEARTRQEVRGNLWRGWKSAVYPKGGRPAYEPVGEIFINGGARSQGAMTYWTEEGVNRAKSGGYLAIPTPEAGVGKRGKPLSPREWERQHGAKLHFVDRGAGKPALLMARMRVYARAGAVARKPSGRALNADGSRAGTKDVLVFVLIPLQRFANKFSVAPIIARREKMLVEDFEARMKKVAAGEIRAGRINQGA